jgi:hypothetical protein
MSSGKEQVAAMESPARRKLTVSSGAAPALAPEPDTPAAHGMYCILCQKDAEPSWRSRVLSRS